MAGSTLLRSGSALEGAWLCVIALETYWPNANIALYYQHNIYTQDKD